jgi:hypothetical protein
MLASYCLDCLCVNLGGPLNCSPVLYSGQPLIAHIGLQSQGFIPIHCAGQGGVRLSPNSQCLNLVMVYAVHVIFRGFRCYCSLSSSACDHT